MNVDEVIREYAWERARAQADYVEALLAEAVVLQRFDRLDRLTHCYDRSGNFLGVASLLQPVEEGWSHG